MKKVFLFHKIIILEIIVVKIIVFSNANNNAHTIIAVLNHFYSDRTPIYHISKNSISEKAKPLYALHKIVQR
jgi:hypothetical protein